MLDWVPCAEALPGGGRIDGARHQARGKVAQLSVATAQEKVEEGANDHRAVDHGPCIAERAMSAILAGSGGSNSSGGPSALLSARIVILHQTRCSCS